jgi:FkbM family methyltransferase
MGKYPKLNSLAWIVILRSYGLPPLSKLVASARGFTMVVSTQFGVFRFRPVFVNEILMALELYEPHVRQIFKPERGQTVIDIGSNIGFYTLRASLQVRPTGRVISVEANPDTFRILRANVKANCSIDTTAFCCAIGAANGFADLYVPSNYAAGSTTLRNSDRSERPRVKVPVRTVDSLVSMLGIRNVDWIKIDVEGGEVGVVAGCRNVIMNHRPKIIIETRNEGVVNYLRENGYDVLPVSGHVGLFYAHPSLQPVGLSQTEFDQQTVAS